MKWANVSLTEKHYNKPHNSSDYTTTGFTFGVIRDLKAALKIEFEKVNNWFHDIVTILNSQKFRWMRIDRKYYNENIIWLENTVSLSCIRIALESMLNNVTSCIRALQGFVGNYVWVQQKISENHINFKNVQLQPNLIYKNKRYKKGGVFCCLLSLFQRLFSTSRGFNSGSVRK